MAPREETVVVVAVERAVGHGDGKCAHNGKKFNKSKIRCFNCQNFGYYSSEYISKKRKKKVYVAEK